LRLVELLKVDMKGRITIPRTVRDALNIEGGSYVVMIADLNKGEITILPSVSEDKVILEIFVLFKDEKGKLAEIAEKLAEMGVNQLATSCKTVKKGESAECQIIAEVPKELDPKEVEERLRALEGVSEASAVKVPQPSPSERA